MQRPMVDYKWLLLMIAGLYGSDEFDSKTLSDDLTQIMYNLTRDSKWVERLQPKLVSNDLRRLYTMGFLRRKKVERRCRNKKGKEYNCGYKYMYQINNQGWSYLGFLLREFRKENVSPLEQLAEEIREDLNEMRTASKKWLAVKYFEEGDIVLAKILLEMANEDIDRKFEGKGYMRFTLKRALLKERLQCWIIVEELQREISRLERELKEKEKIILELKRALYEIRESTTSKFIEP